MKKLRLLFALFAASFCAIQGVWAQDSELTVKVTLLEPGSLGTEILAAPGVDHIKNVVNLTISGPMDDDDWKTLKLINALKTLDLSMAEIKSIPSSQFYVCCGNLTTVKLPNTIESVGSAAFRDKSYLTTINWPTAAKEIPDQCFYRCYNLQPFTIPSGVTRIGSSAFYQCFNFKSTIPSSIKEIGGEAFINTSMEGIDVEIPEGATVGGYAFCNTRVKSITFPSTYYSYNQDIISNPTVTLTFKSPTMMLNGFSAPEGTLRVPQHLVNSYRLDGTWSRWAKVEGFTLASVTDVTTWPIQTSFDMKNNIRMDGTPNVSLNENIVLTITGTNAQNFKDFSFKSTTNAIYNYSYSDREIDYYPTQLLSTCDNVKITGTMEYNYVALHNRWRFMSLPFDFKVGDVTADGDAKFAIRTYDGSSRAATNSSTGNWKNTTESTVIKAGQGFIIQTNHDAWVTFKAQANDSRNYALSNKIFEYALQPNNSSQPDHKGWNLVGNPWQTWYNIHKMNFTAPISIYEDGYYYAYSVIDDDYALKPNQAFFVQCPDNVTKIGFPVDGRQLDDKIESQNAARTDGPSERKLVDVVLTDGDNTDRTRFVLNPRASMDYELTCDASKFFATDTALPQIYTIEQTVPMAINERPAGDGTVQIGISVARDGEYTISSPRCNLKDIVLVDNETGNETSLADGESYTFTAKAGTDEHRFMLRVGGTVITEINATDAMGFGASKAPVYTLDGRKVVGFDGHSTPLQKGVYIVNGKKILK